MNKSKKENELIGVSGLRSEQIPGVRTIGISCREIILKQLDQVKKLVMDDSFRIRGGGLGFTDSDTNEHPKEADLPKANMEIRLTLHVQHIPSLIEKLQNND